ncbi:Uncharacterised protein [Chlamydia trachomatis]|nr:Uncharacterised protein [Chlamydia trachomatis]
MDSAQPKVLVKETNNFTRRCLGTCGNAVAKLANKNSISLFTGDNPFEANAGITFATVCCNAELENSSSCLTV